VRTPEQTVQSQLEAYNARDLERFLEHFAEDVRVFRLPALEPSLSGKAQLEEFYRTQRFNLPDLHAEILNRMVLGNKVVDQERIRGIAEQPLEIVVVFEIHDGLIGTIWAYSAA
jgi:hypothetical protein